VASRRATARRPPGPRPAAGGAGTVGCVTATPELVPAPGAPLAAADPTRRHALRFGDGAVRFPGVTRPEAHRAAPRLAALGGGEAEAALVEVALPALLSDGAGPHLLDAAGRLVLAVADHPRVPGARVAMGAADGAVGPGGGPELIGLVRRDGTAVWRWELRATVPSRERVAALDALDDVRGDPGAAAWRERWDTAPPAAARSR
jgi:hypothetical protein